MAGLCPACLLGEALNHDEDPAAASEFDPVGLAPDTPLGPFQIRSLIGKGGMAAVDAEAREAPPLERTVALKVLPREFLHDDTFARRFTHEARVIASLEHPSIVPIYASGIDEGIPWISMRLLTGGNLSALLQEGPLSVGRTIKILGEVGAALDYAHARGVIHRDVKPSNILMDDTGRAYICDFGLARVVQGIERWTCTGGMIGTPHYMAPEQANGGVDERCDTYSLGVVAYEMLTGSTPFNGDTPLAVLMQHANAPVPDGLRHRCPESMSLAIQKALAKNPGDRWPSAAAFLGALEKGVDAHASGSRSFRLAAAAAIVLIAGGAGAFWLLSDSRGTVPTVATAPPVGDIDGQPPPAAPPVSGNTGRGSGGTKRDESRVAGSIATTEREKRSADVVSNEEEQESPPPPEPATQAPVTNKPDPQEPERVPEAIRQESEPPPAPPRQVVDAPVIKLPTLIRRVDPGYPQIAQALQIQGVVLLRAMVGPDGRVSRGSVEVVRGIDPTRAPAAVRRAMENEATQAAGKFEVRARAKERRPGLVSGRNLHRVQVRPLDHPAARAETRPPAM